MAEFSNEQLNINPEQTPYEAPPAGGPRDEGEGRVFEAPIESSPERAVEFAPAQPAPAMPPAAIPKEEAKIKASELKLLGEEEQIKHLSDLAFHKGIGHAVEVAQNLDNPYLLDKFHDTVVDRLYQELVKRGLLKKV
ncbi:MAG: hypothetical protein AAB851_01550 [Patescibacteria group bacterium]